MIFCRSELIKKNDKKAFRKIQVFKNNAHCFQPIFFERLPRCFDTCIYIWEVIDLVGIEVPKHHDES